MRIVFIITFSLLIAVNVVFSQPNDSVDYRKLLIGSWKVESTEITSEMNETFAVFTIDSNYILRVPFDYYGKDTINLKFHFELMADEIAIYKNTFAQPEKHKIIKLTESELVLRFKEDIRYKRIR